MIQSTGGFRLPENFLAQLSISPPLPIRRDLVAALQMQIEQAVDFQLGCDLTLGHLKTN